MASQVIAATWPMPNGEFLIPKYAFDREHAPYLGQAAILFQLTRRPYFGCPLTDAQLPIPASTYFALSIYYVLGIPLIWIGIRNLRSRKKA
ncbi:MAG: hypothetical protein ACI9R3_003965 [Verrucomicrobiales bacterium]|jgi:hypothetical protein